MHPLCSFNCGFLNLERHVCNTHVYIYPIKLAHGRIIKTKKLAHGKTMPLITPSETSILKVNLLELTNLKGITET
jgi:hypothetical protein